jgi:hypothetical protein
VDEPTQVEARPDSAGQVVPRTFTWLGQRLAVASIGRRWEEKKDVGVMRHFLVMTANGDRFELTHRLDDGDWRVVRVWQRRRPA